MTNQNSLTMKKLFCSLLASAAVFTVAGSATAAGLGVDANAGAGSRSNAGMEAPLAAGVHAEGSAGVSANSPAGNRMGAQGSANQNSQVLPEATRGTERAHEQMNQMGSGHEQATDAEATSRQSVKARHKGKSTAKGKLQQ